jgi:hypothetical protein
LINRIDGFDGFATRVLPATGKNKTVQNQV